MNVFKALKLYNLANKGESILKENAPMQIKIPQLLTLFGSLSAAVGLPTLASGFVHAHPLVYMVIVAAAMVLHAVLPSVFAAPSASDQAATGLNKLGAVLLVLLLFSAACHAQTPATPAPIQNLYGAGISYNVGGTPAIAGTGLYAHLVAGTSTYAFTAVDALPNTLKPFVVSTNVGVGVAQKIVTVGGVPIYIPTAIGVSWTGQNTGWQWNAGGLAVIHLKSTKCASCYLLPSVRMLKSSVSGGTGYQPIVGLLFGWGK